MTTTTTTYQHDSRRRIDGGFEPTHFRQVVLDEHGVTERAHRNEILAASP